MQSVHNSTEILIKNYQVCTLTFNGSKSHGNVTYFTVSPDRLTCTPNEVIISAQRDEMGTPVNIITEKCPTNIKDVYLRS